MRSAMVFAMCMLLVGIQCAYLKIGATGTDSTTSVSAFDEVLRIVQQVAGPDWTVHAIRNNLITVESRQTYEFQWSNRHTAVRELKLYVALHEPYPRERICPKLERERTLRTRLVGIFDTLYPGHEFDHVTHLELQSTGPSDSSLVAEYNDLSWKLWQNGRDFPSHYNEHYTISFASEPKVLFGYADPFPEFKQLIDDVTSQFSRYDSTYCLNTAGDATEGNRE